MLTWQSCFPLSRFTSLYSMLLYACASFQCDRGYTGTSDVLILWQCCLSCLGVVKASDEGWVLLGGFKNTGSWLWGSWNGMPPAPNFRTQYRSGLATVAPFAQLYRGLFGDTPAELEATRPLILTWYRRLARSSRLNLACALWQPWHSRAASV